MVWPSLHASQPTAVISPADSLTDGLFGILCDRTEFLPSCACIGRALGVHWACVGRALATRTREIL